MSAAVGSFLVSALVTYAIGAVRRRRARVPADAG
jgi:hypothetical protein